MLKSLFFETLFHLFVSKRGLLLAATIGFAALLDILGSFQLTERFDTVAFDILGGIYGPLYGWGNRTGQKEIAVLLIDQRSLDTLGVDHWPPDYRSEADLAEWAAAYRPAAIFLDFYYSRPHHLPAAAPALDVFDTGNPGAVGGGGNDIDTEGIADLANRLQRIRSSGTEVFIGWVGDDPNLAPLKALPHQVDLDRGVLPRDSYPVRGQNDKIQAAFALYQFYCEEHDLACQKTDMEKVLGERPLAVQWGFGASKAMGPFVPNNCRGGSLPRRALSALERGFVGFAPDIGKVREGIDYNVAVCSYTDSFSINWLRTRPAGFDPAPLLKDRIVMIGSDIGWLADFVQAPLYGTVPGVMVHAMALDNLIQSGKQAARMSQDFIHRMTYRDFLEVVLEVFGVVVITLVNRLLIALAHPARPGARVWWLTQIGAVLILPSFLALGISRLQHWPAVNVITISGMWLWGLVLLAKELREEAGEPHAKHLSVQG